VSVRAQHIESLESRVFLSVARPSYNTGTGFFVLNGNVYDANGNEFVIRGINQNQWWGNPTENYNAIDHVARTGANAVRAVFFKDLEAPSASGSDTPAERRAIVEKYIANNIVPVVEDHGATENEFDAINKPAALAETVDNWLDPANVDWLQDYERQVILNPANEWGPAWSSTNHVWRDSYITQVQRLRNAGIKNLIMIDAGGWGQDINTIRNDAQAVFNADPEHNIVFSIHFYSQWRTEDRNFDIGGGTFDVNTQLSAVRAQGLPIVVGEFSWEGFSSSPYRTRRVLEICNQLNIGYMGWGWNYNSPVELNMLVDVPGGSVDWQYNSNSDLTTWGDIIVNDPDYGIKATSSRATIYAAAEAPRMILEKTTTTVPEAGVGLTRVRLNKAPASNVIVTLSKVGGGDANVNLGGGGTTLTFTAENWNQYQPIVLSAGSDADTAAGMAKFQLNAAGLQMVDFVAREIDSGIATGSFTLTPTQDRDTQSDVAAGTNATVSASKWNHFFMKFDLASVGGKAASAVLRVYKTQASSNMIGRVWQVFNDNWTQGGATPMLAFPVVSQVMSNSVGYVDFNITALVNQELRGDRMATVAITTNSDNWTAFNTREAAAGFRPQLVINSIGPIPAVDIADVTPDPRPSAVGSMTITFSEAIGGLDLADLSLTRDGSPVSLAGATLSSVNAVTWTLGNLAGATDRVGSYSLTLTAGGSVIVESNGYGIAANTSDAWVMNSLGGTGGAEDVRLVRNGAVTDYFLGGAFQYSFSPSLLSTLSIAPATGDDTITLDFANGNPLPASASIDGGAGMDALRLIGSVGADSAVFDAAAVAFGGAAISYGGIDELTFDGRGGGDHLAVNGGTVALQATQELSSLAIDLTDARLDARDHDILLDYSGASPLGGFDGTTYTGVLGLIAAAYTYGEWTGNGLMTSAPDARLGLTTLAPAIAGDIFGLGPGETTLYDGRTVDATTVIVKYAYAGDLNLDGLVDGADYGIIDNYVQFPGTDGYANGDFNFDGIIDGADYGVIDNTIQLQGPPL
jgi:mannan endo-1,4-beta-mannosidase